MSTVKISLAEFPLMHYIWQHYPVTAIELANFAQGEFEWKKNTTYTVIKRLVERGALQRTEPGFILVPLVTQEQVAHAETDELIARVYKGSQKMFLVSFLQRETIEPEELAALKQAIADVEQKK